MPADATTVSYDSRGGKAVLLASVLGSGMAFLDSTAVNVALPALGRELHTGLSGLQWAVDGYLLTLSALVLTGGALGDVRGQRRVFLFGVFAFTVCSVLCGLAPSTWTLALFRAAQGLGAALLVPASLAMLRTSFPEQDRQRAVSAWAGLSGVTTALGPLLGGWLVDVASWRLVFFINVPMALITAWTTLRHVPDDTPSGTPRKLDVAGSVTAALGLGGVIYALIEGPAHGWRASTVLAAVGGVVMLGVFLGIQARGRHPMLPLGLFASRTFSGANLTTLAVYFALGGVSFLVILALQQELGYSALSAGASLLPLTVLMLVLSPPVGRLAGYTGARPLMTVGPLLAGAGMALLTRMHRGGGYVGSVLPGVLVLGVGLSLTVGPLTSVVLGAVEERHAGIASGVNNAVARIAGLLAVALLPLLGGLAGKTGEAFLAGTRTALWISAGLCVVGALCSWLMLPRDVGRLTRGGAAKDTPPPPHPPRATSRLGLHLRRRHD
ncbi:MFS transporter [Myxococcus sp. K15C18031901]|uniref:MFS transporter n=1 Tax=Myxococcus dinghuensis TaxID=2906761 RepID=UPI0020A6E181|nr:MFS transporter [Myxococcus dinghuensis]MCP3099117.1 MFS transporter [Myxococcus dinghuensis]